MRCQIIVHPGMTAQQLHAWCLRHDMCVRIRHVPLVGSVALEAHPSRVQVLAYPNLPEEPVYGEA